MVLAAVWAGLPWLSALVAVAASLGALELYRMAEGVGHRPAVLPGVGWTLLFIVGGHMGGWAPPAALAAGAVTTLTWHQIRRVGSLQRLFRETREPRDLRESLVDWAHTAAGAIYMGWTLSLALALRQEPDGLAWVLVALLGTYATDSGAFFTGRAWGRRPLAPTISPGKTWEGAVGGFLFGAVAVVALVYALSLPVPVWQGVLLGVLLGVATQVGDLLESKVKRASEVKDSGTLIPGHGGVLDRLDSVVFAVVVVYHFNMLVVA